MVAINIHYIKNDDVNYVITSDQTTKYNSVAWAIGGIREKDRWWSPCPGYFWPADLSKNENLDTYVTLFKRHGYIAVKGNDVSLEPGYRKVALFTTSDKVTHVARQLRDGCWTSKIGNWHDILHPTLNDLPQIAPTNAAYVSQVLKKRIVNWKRRIRIMDQIKQTIVGSLGFTVESARPKRLKPLC